MGSAGSWQSPPSPRSYSSPRSSEQSPPSRRPSALTPSLSLSSSSCAFAAFVPPPPSFSSSLPPSVVRRRGGSTEARHRHAVHVVHVVHVVPGLLRGLCAASFHACIPLPYVVPKPQTLNPKRLPTFAVCGASIDACLTRLHSRLYRCLNACLPLPYHALCLVAPLLVSTAEDQQGRVFQMCC